MGTPDAPVVEPPKRPPVVRTLVGRPMATRELEETLLPKWMALPIFASDPISSVAYATEAAMVVLVGVSLTALHEVIPISIGIAILLALVTASYRQTVHAYETSGGAYVVARENLGVAPALVAAASLLIDYILTVAVSVASGVLAITSAASLLHGYETEISVAVVVGIMLANLRGVREAGVIFALPTYAFIAVLGTTIAVGIAKCATRSCPHAATPHPLAAGAGTLTVFVLLKAFASGSSALTGVESIANGVNAFRRPQSRNAGQTLLILGAVAIGLFLGVSYLAYETHARPSATDSVLSQVGRAVFPTGSGSGFVYYLLQGFTFAILIFAANTSFQGFPRLAALVAQDRYFPRQFVNLGDRLVYSNGIFALSGIAIALIVAFKANVNSLIHLYVVGVFTAFTLSQTGMVRYWQRLREPGWQRRALVNGIGATATGVVTVVVVLTKFAEGAWIVIVAIPLFVAGFYGIHRHYRNVARRLAAGSDAVRRARGNLTHEVVIPVQELDATTRYAVWYARAVVGKRFHGVHVPQPGLLDPRGRWSDFSGGADPLELAQPVDGHWSEAIRDYVWRLPRGERDFVTVLVPEHFQRPRLLDELRSREALRVKSRLLGEPGMAVANVTIVGAGPAELPKRLACRVLVSGAHAASLRAVNYANTLAIADSAAVYFAHDEHQARNLRGEWGAARIDLPLELVEAPYRDLGDPLLRYLRALTSEGTLVVVIMPELVLAGWRRLLHNERALYIKRLLLFEQGVVLTSVPYQLAL